MSRQLDVLSPGNAADIEPISRAMALREELELRSLEMELQREGMKTQQEQFKTEMAAREHAQVMAVDEAQKGRDFAAEQQQAAEAADQRRTERLAQISERATRNEQDFLRQQQDRQNERDDKFRNSILEGARAVRTQHLADAARIADLRAQSVAAREMLDATEGRMRLDAAALTDHVTAQNAALADRERVLYDEATVASSGLQTYIANLERGTPETTQRDQEMYNTQTGQRVEPRNPRVDSDLLRSGTLAYRQTQRDVTHAPVEAMIDNIGGVLNVQQKDALRGFYRVLASAPTTGVLPEAQRAAIAAAKQRVTDAGLDNGQLYALMDGFQDALAAQLGPRRPEDEGAPPLTPRLRAVYEANIGALSRMSEFGIASAGPERDALAKVPAYIVDAMLELGVPEDEIRARLGPDVLNNKEIMTFVDQIRKAREERIAAEEGIRTRDAEQIPLEQMMKAGPDPALFMLEQTAPARQGR